MTGMTSKGARWKNVASGVVWVITSKSPIDGILVTMVKEGDKEKKSKSTVPLTFLGEKFEYLGHKGDNKNA